MSNIKVWELIGDIYPIDLGFFELIELIERRENKKAISQFKKVKKNVHGLPSCPFEKIRESSDCAEEWSRLPHDHRYELHNYDAAIHNAFSSFRFVEEEFETALKNSPYTLIVAMKRFCEDYKKSTDDLYRWTRKGVRLLDDNELTFLGEGI